MSIISIDRSQPEKLQLEQYEFGSMFFAYNCQRLISTVSNLVKKNIINKLFEQFAPSIVQKVSQFAFNKQTLGIMLSSFQDITTVNLIILYSFLHFADVIFVKWRIQNTILALKSRKTDSTKIEYTFDPLRGLSTKLYQNVDKQVFFTFSRFGFPKVSNLNKSQIRRLLQISSRCDQSLMQFRDYDFFFNFKICLLWIFNSFYDIEN